MEAFFEIGREFEKKVSFIINQNEDCTAHFHSNIEITYVVSGSIDATVRGVQKRLTKGDIAIACSYEPHSFSTVGASELHVWLFPTDLVPAFTSLTQDKMFVQPFLEHCPRTQEIVTLMKALEQYSDAEKSMTAKGYMYAILGILQEEIGLCRKNSDRQSDLLIQNILLYIGDHYKENLTVSELSRHFGYNKDYISRMINQHIHCGFNRYVNVLRVRNARSLIEKGEKNLDEICERSGFGCMKTFRRAFTDYYDLTPREYQRSLSRIRES